MPISACWAAQLREWFEAEPWRTSGELFERLQNEQPGVFPDGQRRTLQRRLKAWRSEMAHKLVFGAKAAGDTAPPPTLKQADAYVAGDGTGA